EQEIFGYHEKMIGLENRIKYSNLKEDMNKYINSISSVEDFEKRISNFVNILDSFIGYRINSIVVLFFHKIIKRFDKVIFWNIPEYLQENIRYNLREIEKSMDSYNIINFLSDFRVVYKGDEDFKLIMKFYYSNIRSIVNIPLNLGDEKVGSILIFFGSNVELSKDERAFLASVSKELSRRLLVIKNQETLEKIRYIYNLVQEFLKVLYFQDGQSNLNRVFEYLYIIISKLGFKNLFIFKEKKEYSLSNIMEFSLEYIKVFDNEDCNYPYSLSVPREFVYSLDKVMIFEKDKNYESKYQFINTFFSDTNHLIFIIPFYDARYSQFYEYYNSFAIAVSDNLSYSQFEIQVFNLMQKMLSMIYNNMFLYYLNVKDKRILFEVFEVMNDGIIVIDLEKRVLLINKSAVDILEIAHKPTDIIERRFFINDLLIDKSGDIIQKILSCEDLVKRYVEEGTDTINGEAVFEYDDKVKIIKYNFSLLHFPIDSEDIMLEESDIYNYLIVLKDVTEQKNLEKEKDDFVATISHDIKTPLTTMKGYLSALLRYPDKITPDQRDSYLRVINSEIDRINRMLNNLMDLRKLEGNILKINPVKFDIIKVINKVVDIFKISYVNFDFFVSSSVNSVVIYADKDKIEQVLHNLLSNAVKYSPTGGKITINLEIKSKEVVISVSDQGIGIPVEEIDKVFEKYYRTHDTQKKKIVGKGLGLYITKRIVELHKGKVWVKSELNKGTTFYFSLPL
ncbi:MAG: ATP-binding protein, partial [Candidatus Calescibacterium sp.]|nr:cell wall metabolism sensor histidine kinase WalK [Candidatus Calescibacterium sp.]MDW8132054.1 ATP-binding protein [Candidatus Calescibacterium sp.]